MAFEKGLKRKLIEIKGSRGEKYALFIFAWAVCRHARADLYFLSAFRRWWYVEL